MEDMWTSSKFSLLDAYDAWLRKKKMFFRITELHKRENKRETNRAKCPCLEPFSNGHSNRCNHY
jgi:hypothetical protein